VLDRALRTFDGGDNTFWTDCALILDAHSGRLLLCLALALVSQAVLLLAYFEGGHAGVLGFAPVLAICVCWSAPLASGLVL
jgi:hypothetical protein